MARARPARFFMPPETSPGSFSQVVHEADQLGVAVDELTDLGLVLARVLAQREGDVVVEVHGTEQGAVLEQDAELLAHLVEAPLAQADDLVAVDPDLPARAAAARGCS